MTVFFLILTVAATVVACEAALRCPWARLFATFRGNAVKSLRVLQSRRISDHFKARVLPAYSVRNLAACGRILGYLLLVLLPFSVPAMADHLAGRRDLWSGEAALVILAASVIYTGVRLYASR